MAAVHGDDKLLISDVARHVHENSLELTEADVKRLRWKIDWAIVPYVSLLYLLSFLDRVNIGQASTAGLNADLKLVGNQYAIALSVFFVSYVAVEVPSNLLLKRLKPHRWICLIMVTWSIIMICMGLVHNAAGLEAARFFLGLAEGGLFPGINYMLTTWYTREEQNMRISIFFAGATLAGAWGGLLAFGIRHMDGIGGKGGWAWIFILEGLLTFICAVPAYWLVQDFPDESNLLSPHDRARWLHRLSSSQGVTNAQLMFTWKQVKDAFTDWKTYVYALMYIGIAEPFYSLALFTPAVITGLGFSNANANLMTIPPYVVGFLTTLATAYWSDRVLVRGPFIVVWMGIVIVAYIILLCDVSVGVKYFALFLAVAGDSPCIASCITFIGNNVGPTYKRAAAMGFFFTIGNSGGLVASNVYPATSAPRYIEGHAIALAFSAMSIVCAIIISVHNRWENKRRDEKYGVPPADGSECSPLRASDPVLLKKFGLEGLAPHQVMELGDNHPAFRYIW
ncbi:putative MFS nicotinic acid transporter Tna1 [Calocera cornea HHB12733]|uniref:Putative MFS nicotinic acid transporter Tna1 n=1 Tax=Calocera cornea HHB12733 TaxID=1353952 RepID=A0A165EN47_9BASI|nr:putative MFS nicotinic acid transporter Tna1 [Calocera cornea HHB12733]